jgi:three-Cys-motif partner protein
MPNSGDIPERHREILDHVFGSQRWFDIYQAKLQGQDFAAKAFLDLYYKGLLDLGYLEQTAPQPLRNSLGNTIYYMLWVGQHPAGQRIMRSVLKTQGKQLTFGI